MSEQRVAAEDRQRWKATFDDLAARFDDYFAELLVRPGWWPGFESATGQALSRLREIGLASEAVLDDAWLRAAYRALQRWQAFRGARGGVPEGLFRQVVRRLGPPLRMIESSTIEEVGEDEIGQLFELFTALAPLKPTRAKWVVTSKTL